MVLVQKSLNKWWMCVDFTDLNTAYPKDPYLLSNIDMILEGSSSYKTFNFMDVYSG